MMETRFIDGGEYVDRQTYLIMRNINSQLRERIAELEAQNQAHESYARQVEEQLRISKARIKELQARLNALELKSALPWEEDWERGYVCGWNECRKAALGGDEGWGRLEQKDEPHD